jgi:hypothetical protein
VQVGTSVRTQRTATGIGPGSFWLKLVKAYPGGACTFVADERGSLKRNGGLEYLVPHKGGTQTLFQLNFWPAQTPSSAPLPKTYAVVSVTVGTPYQPRPEFAPGYPFRCKSGYQSTPLPTPK